MNRKVKLLRLLSLALLAIERAVCAVSYRVGEYTLSTLATSLAEEENQLYEDWLDADNEQDQGHLKTVLDWVTEDNTDLYNALAYELDLEQA